MSEVEKKLYEEHIAELEIEYECHGSAVTAWRAWGLARESGLQIPGFVAEYLDRCGRAVEIFADHRGTHVARREGFQGATDFWPPRDLLAAFELTKRDVRHYIGLYKRSPLAEWFFASLQDGLSRTAAKARLAMEWSVSERTVERAVQEWAPTYSDWYTAGQPPPDDTTK